MSDSDPDPKALRELEERLRKARKRTRPEIDTAPPSKLGMAFRLVTELVAAVVIGVGIGLGLDRVLGTMPLFLITMLFLGLAAGFRNVIRTAREMNENASPDEG